VWDISKFEFPFFSDFEYSNSIVAIGCTLLHAIFIESVNNAFPADTRWAKILWWWQEG